MNPWVTVGETATFVNCAKGLVADDEREAIIAFLSENPESGVVIEGTGGIRKLRWALPGKGKSGGVRVIYYFHSQKIPLYVFSMYPKSKKDNLTDEEKNTLKRLVAQLKKAAGV